ncbi:hypothetical protein QA600_05790 [Natronococcus sp. A-GB1]|uniref:hypothetical protein n=1 Tax=Natronococcus sp. A-GB1 TaxID=3037648 RepID=UPI00241F14E6|nr:hypothetical protein [Natronococcus sp. A-GB1]MDG5758849.1 hypothetical protein [Natronococcus sp. A-GB1]
MEDNQVSPKARETEQILAREGRATRQMVANELNVSGTRATQLLKELIRDSRVRRIDHGLYEHEYYSHEAPDDLERLRQFRQSEEQIFEAIRKYDDASGGDD